MGFNDRNLAKYATQRKERAMRDKRKSTQKPASAHGLHSSGLVTPEALKAAERHASAVLAGVVAGQPPQKPRLRRVALVFRNQDDQVLGVYNSREQAHEEFVGFLRPDRRANVRVVMGWLEVERRSSDPRPTNWSARARR
jgi:hypothetical protein